MRIEIFCTRDQAADLFNPPWHAPSLGLALRSFADEANRVDPNNMINKHPNDFSLWHLGCFDQATGKHELLPHPKQVALARDLIERPKPSNDPYDTTPAKTPEHHANGRA